RLYRTHARIALVLRRNSAASSGTVNSVSVEAGSVGEPVATIFLCDMKRSSVAIDYGLRYFLRKGAFS
ncbi:MAG: hypothetical protein WAL74_06865, partial [Candidatus Acidiferrales bacterium]